MHLERRERDIRLRGDNPIELLDLAAILEYQRPGCDTTYWWPVEGEDLVAMLEDEWRELLGGERSDPGDPAARGR
jgi:hypothetical protein